LSLCFHVTGQANLFFLLETGVRQCNLLVQAYSLTFNKDLADCLELKGRSRWPLWDGAEISWGSWTGGPTWFYRPDEPLSVKKLRWSWPLARYLLKMPWPCLWPWRRPHLVLFRSRHLDLLALPGLSHRRSCPKLVATGSTGPDLGHRWICPPRLRSPRFWVAMPNFIRHRCTLPGHRVDGDPSLHVDATPLQCPGPFPLGGPPRASSWAGSHEIVAGTPVFDVQK
jgi:hypothetical protein